MPCTQGTWGKLTTFIELAPKGGRSSLFYDVGSVVLVMEIRSDITAHSGEGTCKHAVITSRHDGHHVAAAKRQARRYSTSYITIQ
jgi:hypothetical protein